MSIRQLFDQTLLAEASYAVFWDDGTGLIIDKPGVKSAL